MKDADTDRLDKALATLCEHFDSIQIVATRHEGDKTFHFHRGTGNWYSRFGAVVEWVDREKARVTLEEQGREA